MITKAFDLEELTNKVNSETNGLQYDVSENNLALIDLFLHISTDDSQLPIHGTDEESKITNPINTWNELSIKNDGKLKDLAHIANHRDLNSL
jgi:hypothetical protein